MNKKAVASELVKVAKLLTALGEIPIATNYSHHSWDDFSDSKTARVYLNEHTNELRLEITETVENTGINSYKRSGVVESADLGTLDKPRIGNVPSLLKKNGHESTGAGGPFKSKWYYGDGGHGSPQASLGQIIKDAASQRIFTPSSAPTSAPSGYVLPTPEEQDMLKNLLKNVDTKTIGVEDATDTALAAIKAGDENKIKHALGFLDGSIGQLVESCNSYKAVVKHIGGR